MQVILRFKHKHAWNRNLQKDASESNWNPEVQDT